MAMREAYIEKVTAQLIEWQTWIERYKAGDAVLKASRLVDPKHMQERLDACYQLACSCLTTLDASSKTAWEGAKEEVERALVDLKTALDESGAGRAGQRSRGRRHRAGSARAGLQADPSVPRRRQRPDLDGLDCVAVVAEPPAADVVEGQQDRDERNRAAYLAGRDAIA